jgi:hypothetical protein
MQLKEGGLYMARLLIAFGVDELPQQTHMPAAPFLGARQAYTSLVLSLALLTLSPTLHSKKGDYQGVYYKG